MNTIEKGTSSLVLIVDDMRLVRNMLIEALRPEGYQILTAADGLAAFEIAQESKPDVILLDLEMPVLNGDETLKLLKDCDATCEIPVLMVTDEDEVEKTCQLLEQGAADHIGKPFSPSVVRARVRNAIRSYDNLKSFKETQLTLENRVLERTHALQEAMCKAESATKSKSEFLANMSHELRTPLTAILGFAETILTDSDIANEPQERIDAVNIVIRNGEYLLSLINGILDLSKIEAGKIELENLPCSPFGLVEDVTQLMQIRADSKNLSLQAKFLNDLPANILTDPTRLQQVLVNLVGNALKFTELGSVALEISSYESPNRDVWIQFDIVDTGVGMTDDQLKRIFDPFAQADNSTTRNFGGTGLGLSISKRLAGLLGGDLEVESDIGIGSRFSLTLNLGQPRVPMITYESFQQEKKKTKSESVSMASQPNEKLDCRILLVEDGPDNQRLISFILNKAGAEVTVAENGLIGYEKAMEAYHAGDPFAAILMDMQMPVLDGYDATRKIRSENYEGPIIAVTAHAMDGEMQKCLDAGCTDYAVKPIDRKALISKIARLVQPVAK